MAKDAWNLDPDRCFSPEPGVRARARELHAAVAGLPIVSPHGHVDPRLLAGEDPGPRDPATLFVSSDHYVFGRLYGHGVPHEELGLVPTGGGEAERDPRSVWRRFCERFDVFDGTPAGLWLKTVLVGLLGVRERPAAENADALFDALAEALSSPENSPAALMRRFGVEFLATTDPADATLEEHRAAQAAGLRVVPTFRPDALMQVADPGWRDRVARLGELVGFEVDSLEAFVAAIAARRRAFRDAGATASDHATTSSALEAIDSDSAAELFARALQGQADGADAERFHAHMLFEMARMATEDGLVMQLHLGSLRNHDLRLLDRFGPEVGGDMPVAMDLTRGLQSLLNAFGGDPRFRLVVYTLDEATYSRELAPLAGHYPAVRLGSPWWFHDSVGGIERYLDGVVETAGFAKLAGFVDDARSLPVLWARHDVWRRTTCDWLARLQLRGLLDAEAAERWARWLAHGASADAFRVAG